MDNSKLVESLAAQVGEKTIKAGIREVILDALLGEVQGNVVEATMEALLLYGGRKVQERDVAWIRELSLFVPKGLPNAPTTPAELEKHILAWQASREQDLRRSTYKTAYSNGFQDAHAAGTKLGWAGHAAGKNLDEVLEASKTACDKAKS